MEQHYRSNSKEMGLCMIHAWQFGGAKNKICGWSWMFIYKEMYMKILPTFADKKMEENHPAVIFFIRKYKCDKINNLLSVTCMY